MQLSNNFDYILEMEIVRPGHGEKNVGSLG